MAFDPAQQRTVVIRDPALRQFEGGFTALPNRILKHRDLSLGARMTYGMLLSYAWQKDFCHPAQERIAVDLGVSDRSVRTFLAELRENQLITWKRQGLNKPNIYYLLKLPNAPDDNHPGPANSSAPDRKQASVQDRQSTSDKEYSKKNTKNVNVITPLPSRTGSDGDEQRAHEDYLVSEILAVCGDRHSTGLYKRIARTAPPDLVYEAIAETRSQARLGLIQKSCGALFTSLIKRRATDLGIDLGLH
jgi:hypothetical protein